MTRTAIIYGGSAGIGRATVRALIAEGYRVGVVARDRDRLEQVKADEGVMVEVESADVADADGLARATDDLIARLAAVPTVWINCAMATSFSPFREMPPEEFARIVDVTFMGQVNGTRIALDRMTRGVIVNVGSALAYRSVPLQSAYCAAKSAVRAFAASIRSELIHQGRPIQLSHVVLPAVDTPQFDWARSRLQTHPQPAPPIHAPEVAARGILHAIRGKRREVVVGRSSLQLMVAEMLAPGPLDRLVAEAGVTQQQSDRPDPGTRTGNLYDPASYPAHASGSYGERAQDRGLIVDADAARYAAVGTGLLLALGLGIAVGRAFSR